jgi:hypothetical protein
MAMTRPARMARATVTVCAVAGLAAAGVAGHASRARASLVGDARPGRLAVLRLAGAARHAHGSQRAPLGLMPALPEHPLGTIRVSR